MKSRNRLTVLVISLVLVGVLIWIGVSDIVRAARLPADLIWLPRLSPAASCGPVGQTIAVTGEGYLPNGLVQVTWSGIALGTIPAPVQVDPAGRLRFSFIVPNDQPGLHTVQVAGDGISAQFAFDLGGNCPTATPTTTPAQPTPTGTPSPTGTPPTPVVEQPRLRCEPMDVSPEALIYVHGENFQPGGAFHQLRWDDVIIPWAPEGLTIGDDGRFTLWFAAPSDTYALHTLVADDGQGGQADCYINLTPRDPTPTWTPTPTLSPTPTPTWTPGPPPGLTVTPAVTPEATEYCARIEAAFSREPLAQGTVTAGVEISNQHRAWSEGQLQLGLWQYQNLTVSDTGLRVELPALEVGETTTLPLSFEAPRPGPVWYQLRLIETVSGQSSACPSTWVPLDIQPAQPYPPPLLTPPNQVWLDTRQLRLAWTPAEVPPDAGPVAGYELQLLDLAGGELLNQTVGPEVTEVTHVLAADYAQLAWRVRARNGAGWGLWATAYEVGVDTRPPQVELSLEGEVGQNGWWRSPLTVRVGGSDPGPGPSIGSGSVSGQGPSTLLPSGVAGQGSGLTATYVQPGRAKWQQLIPGGSYLLDREGEHLLRAYGRDRALNRSGVLVRPVKLDWQPPERLVSHFSGEPTASGWYTTPLTISLTAEDVVSGLAEQKIRISGSSWQTGTLTLSQTGRYSLEYRARDIAGNESDSQRTTAKLDLTPPVGEIALGGNLCQTCQPIIASISSKDADSGLAHWTLSLALPEVVTSSLLAQTGETVLASGSQPTATVTLAGGELPPGDLRLRLTVQDVAGWVTTETVSVYNGPAVAEATPTPWLRATATPWPSPTPGVLPYVTITAPDTGDGDGNDGRRGGGGGDTDRGQNGDPPSRGDAQPGYPVGDTVVPAILPVTGARRE